MATQPIEIKDIFGKVLFASKKAKTIGEAATEAVRAGVCLSYSDLSDSNLSYSNLSRSDLSDSDLSYSNLSDCDLSRSDLSYSNLSRSDLMGSNLRDSNLRGSDLRGSDLRGSDFSGSDLRDSDLRDSDLMGSVFKKSTLKGTKTSLEESLALRPIQLSDKYWITIFDTSMWIGCQYHRLSDWWSFTDREIIEMDGKEGLKWWRTWKPFLQQIVKSREEA